ncbi:MAG TPA: C39 family peptidase [Stenomitos sp.]
MSVGKLGSYADILTALHRMVQTLPAAAPVQPAAPTSAYAPLGRDVFVASPRPTLDPNSFFISQVRTDRWNPNANSGNTNCGPASLAMALKAVGLMPPGLQNPANPEEWIDQTRMAMEGDANDFKLTSDDDVLRGALASGAKAEKVYDLSGVEQAVRQGKLVVLAGNPVAYENRFTDDQYAKFNGGHFILVTGIQGDRVTINDPQSKAGSLTISRAELAAYMAFKDWNVGVSIAR